MVFFQVADLSNSIILYNNFAVNNNLPTWQLRQTIFTLRLEKEGKRVPGANCFKCSKQFGVKTVHDQRYQGGLWAALFLILLLPFLFLRSGMGSTALTLPVLGLKASIPRAQPVWEYYGQADRIPCWLGGKLTKQQLISEDNPSVLVALDAAGAVLWEEENDAKFKAVSDGENMVLATDSGQVTVFASEQGVRWSEATGWAVQALALATEGEVAIAQGPVLEGPSNLLERVRLYSSQGELLHEHLLRNNSVILLLPTQEAWVLSSVTLAEDQPRGQLIGLTAELTEATTLWHSREIIHALAVGDRGIAAAAGNNISIFPFDDEDYRIELKDPVSDLAWTPGGELAVIQAGDSPLAPAKLTLLSAGGEKIWQRRLKSSARALAVRHEEVLAADQNIVYSFSLSGDTNWCYESPTPVRGLYPLAEKKEVVVTTMGNHLLLLEPPD